jgi:hypothetical protein
MQIDEAIELLEKEEYLLRGVWTKTPGIKAALAKLRKIPKPTETTKKARAYCNSVIEYARFVKKNVSEKTKDKITKKLFDLLFEGFEIIEQQAKQHEEDENIYKQVAEQNDILIAENAQLQAKIDKLKETMKAGGECCDMLQERIDKLCEGS